MEDKALLIANTWRADFLWDLLKELFGWDDNMCSLLGVLLFKLLSSHCISQEWALFPAPLLRESIIWSAGI